MPLEHLDLSGFLNVTDEGALPISQMRKLRYLNLDGTKVTDEGIAMFKGKTKGTWAIGKVLNCI